MDGMRRDTIALEFEKNKNNLFIVSTVTGSHDTYFVIELLKFNSDFIS